MRKLILEEWISLDGHTSDKNGSLDFFAHTIRDTYTNEQQFLNTIDTILLGRTTYEQFSKTWPQRPIENDPLAETINKGRKIVFSNTLQEAHWSPYPKAEMANGNAIEYIRQLKATPGKNFILWGSISLAQTFMKENLIDEYRLHVCPVVTGGGGKLFKEAINLKLVETKQYANGNTLLIYRPAV
jgi:Dihydrofolate reductase